MADILEAVMIVTFGISWPVNIVKLVKSRSTKGASILFYVLIDLGYVAGIIAKFVKLHNGVSTPWYVLFFYFVNFFMVFTGIIIWLRNRSIEKKQ